MGLFAFLWMFDKDNAANISGVLSSLFGIVGTLVRTYFVIMASSDAQVRNANTAKQAVTQQKETSKEDGDDGIGGTAEGGGGTC
jgi:hypothetical protein